MGRKGAHIAKWTQREYDTLVAAVAEAKPLLDVYKRNGYTVTDWWGVIAGIMLTRCDLLVTGKACWRQWQKLGKPEPSTIEEPDVKPETFDHKHILQLLEVQRAMAEDLDEILRILRAMAGEWGLKIGG